MTTLEGIKVGPIGYGLMSLTWRAQNASDEESFSAMKAAINSGANFWSSADFYGTADRTDNLKVIRRYFDKNPQDAGSVYLAVKGGTDTSKFLPEADGSKKAIDKTVETASGILGDTKKIDNFTLARINPSNPIEETAAAVAEHIAAGRVGSFGLSEASAETIRRAHKVQPVSSVELEYSLWSREAETNGVFAACKELGIAVIAYSPLGQGMFTGQYKKVSDFPPGHFAPYGDRFNGDAFDTNLKLVEFVETLAKQEGVTASQLALAWIRSKSNTKDYPIIIPVPGSRSQKRVEENSKLVDVSSQTIGKLDQFLEDFKVVGERGNEITRTTYYL